MYQTTPLKSDQSKRNVVETNTYPMYFSMRPLANNIAEGLAMFSPAMLLPALRVA